MQKKQIIAKARIIKYDEKLIAIWKGREITLKELRNRITELIVEEMKCEPNEKSIS